MSVIDKSLNKQTDFNSSASSGVTKNAGASAGLKFAVFGAFLISLLSLAGSSLLYQSLNSERRERQALEGAQDQTREKSLSLEKTLENDKAQIEELQTRLKEAEAGQVQFRKSIEDTRAVIAGLQKKLKDSEEIKNKLVEMKTGFSAETTAPTTSTPGATSATTSKAAAPSKTAASAKAPAVEKPVVRSPQVLTVNRKFNFVVISIGLKDGLQMGDALEVLHNGKPAANVQIEKLYESFAAATIVKESKEDPIKEGDSIRKLKS